MTSYSVTFPGFLTAMRQEITRAHKGWALDGVFLDNDVTKMMKEDVATAPSEGEFVSMVLRWGSILYLWC